jgi:hypothetical protein
LGGKFIKGFCEIGKGGFFGWWRKNWGAVLFLGKFQESIVLVLVNSFFEGLKD